MTEGRTHTMLPGRRRCVYCGHPCHGRTCRAHADLPPLEALPPMRDDLASVGNLAVTGSAPPFGRREGVPTPSPATTSRAEASRFRATCPNPRCGELARPGRKRCAYCRTALYPTKAMLRKLKRP